MLASKFVDGLPFYRQERIFDVVCMGLDISRATMCGWALQVARALSAPRRLALRGESLRANHQLGRNRRPSLGRSRSGQHQPVLYVAGSGGPPEHPAVLFHYAPTRSGKVAEELVGDFQGYLPNRRLRRLQRPGRARSEKDCRVLVLALIGRAGHFVQDDGFTSWPGTSSETKPVADGPGPTCTHGREDVQAQVK